MIAWISHHLPLPDGTLVGGAEMSDLAILESSPVDIDIFGPNNWEKALDYEKIIITGTDLLDPYAMTTLAKKNPVVMVHHEQTRSPYRAELINNASMFICRTPRHLEIELGWTNPKNSDWVLSPLDITEFSIKPKLDFALWAGRWHPQKGPAEAQAWAENKGIQLLMLTDKPREEVLEAMSLAKYFVFLPTGFDAEPRALIEAVLSGCEIHTNNLAGLTSVPGWNNPEILSELVSNAKDLFWELALK